MKLPGEQGLRAIAGVVALLIVIGVCAWFYLSGKSSADFDNVVSKVETLQASADISKEAGNKAGRIIQESNRETIDDGLALAAARAPGATAADRERVRERARQAFAEGQRAACRMQREDCGPAADPAAGD